MLDYPLGRLNNIHIAHDAPYKIEPDLKDVLKIIEECEEVADKFKIEPFGEIECPMPQEGG